MEFTKRGKGLYKSNVSYIDLAGTSQFVNTEQFPLHLLLQSQLHTGIFYVYHRLQSIHVLHMLSGKPLSLWMLYEYYRPSSLKTKHVSVSRKKLKI